MIQTIPSVKLLTTPTSSLRREWSSLIRLNNPLPRMMRKKYKQKDCKKSGLWWLNYPLPDLGVVKVFSGFSFNIGCGGISGNPLIGVGNPNNED